MHLSLEALALASALAASFFASPVLADDADKAACADLDEGDECTRGDGDPGVCIPDESDTGVLSCDDDTLGSGSSSSSGSSSDDGTSGCSASGRRTANDGMLAVGVAAVGLALLRRKRAASS